MAIDPKLVSIVPASQLPSGDPTNAADFLFYEGDALKKGSMSNIYDKVTSGIKGVATQTNAPTAYTPETYPNGLFERYIVSAPITSPNSWGNIAVTQAELDANFVYFNVTNGVVSKEVSDKPTAELSTVLNPTNTTEATTGKAVSDYIKSDNSQTIKFEVISQNLINKNASDYMLRTVIGSNGIIYNDIDNMEVSGFTPVESETFYTPNQKHNVIFYDYNKIYISGTDSSRVKLSFKTPPATAYVRVNSEYNKGEVRLVKGDFNTFPENGNDEYKLGVKKINGVSVIPESNLVTKTSQLQNDSQFVTAPQISGFVATDYLYSNYWNKTDNKNYIDGKFSGLQVGASQISGGAITKEKIATTLWNEIAGGNISITNNPDEGDLTVENAQLRLKDRSNYVYLKKGTVITQALVNSWSDKIIDIRFDHSISENLNFNNTITLLFNGGWLYATSEKKLNGSGAKIIADRYYIFRNIFTNKIDDWEAVSSRFSAKESYPEWFGSGNGVIDCKAMRLALAKVDCPISLKRGKVYETNASIEGSIIGNFATIKKNPIQIDINVTSAIPQNSTNEIVITVDANSADLAKLKVGMQVEFVNKESNTRKVNLAFKIITAINGNQITLYGFSGGVNGFAAGEAQMINAFKGITLNKDSEFIENLRIDGSRSAFTHNRTFWEFSQEIFISSLARNTRVRNCIIQNCNSEGITIGGVNTSVVGCMIGNCGGNGIHLSGSYGALIQHNFIYDTNKKLSTGHNEGAITYSNEVFATKIIDNVFDGCLTGIGSIDSGFNSDSFISNNTFRRYKMHGIDATCTTGGGSIVDNMVIIGNRFCGKHLPKQSEANYLPAVENNYTEAVGDGVRLMANGVQIQSVIVSDNIFECASVNFKNAEIVFNGNTFVEKAQSFSAEIPDYLVTMNNVQGSMNGNNIISIGSPNRLAIFDITASDVAINGNFIKGNVIQKSGQTTDFAGNKVVTI